jgi:ArsR family transcriptional regulator
MVLALKSAAEPTRLRLLALLSHGELQVGEICRILGQSQPRVSRHLRLLAEAGFLERFREQQCVYYRTPVFNERLVWLRQLLAEVDRNEPVLQRDRARLAQVGGVRARIAGRKLNEASAMAAQLTEAVLDEFGPVGVGELLDIGTGSGQLLQAIARRARRAVGIDISAPALQVARARLHGAGLSHCEFRRGDMYELPYADASFDAITMDRVLAAALRPAAAIREAARALRPGGRLIVVEQSEQFDTSTASSPLRQLRQWFKDAGLNTETLRPLLCGDSDWLIATARRQIQ